MSRRSAHEGLPRRDQGTMNNGNTTNAPSERDDNDRRAKTSDLYYRGDLCISRPCNPRLGRFCPLLLPPCPNSSDHRSLRDVWRGLFSGGKLSAGEREDRANRWVLVAFAIIGLLAAYLPAYTDRKEIQTLDGDTIRWLGVALFAAVVRYASGQSLSWGVALVGWSRSSLGIRWSPLVSIGSSATRAIWGCSSTRLGGPWSFVRASRVLLTALLIPPLLARIRARRCCVPSSAMNTMPTAPARRGWFPGYIDTPRRAAG